MKRKSIILILAAWMFQMNVIAAATDDKPMNGKKITVYTTAENTDYRLSLTESARLEPFRQPLETEPCIFVDPSNQFQTFLGIGGAITDAAAETLAKLPAAKQQEIIERYYDAEKGIGYSLARTTIHSCDFSSGSYTYVKDNDARLESFDVAHDRQFRIPMLRKAIAAAGGKLTIYASPWSPPAWMKDNNNMLQGGKLKPEYYPTWADYFVKFFQAYEKEGVPLWGYTVQNEPMAKQTWESCIYTAEEERDFISKHLGPAMTKAGLGDRKLIAWDHNRDLVYQRASTILSDPEAAKYVWGIGFHWYESWTGGGNIYDNIRRVQESYPGKALIFTEGCADSFRPEKMAEWSFGEMYGRSMINDFNNGTVGWTDWNVLLDETGGPNHVQNFCFAPVHADTRTGEVQYLSSYFYIGHFSKFIKPGARRIVSSPSRGQFLTTAFINPDGKMAVIVMNQGSDKISYRLWIKGSAAELVSLPRSIQTIIVE